MKIIECPRDAMQGIEQFIPTEIKAKYINLLLKAGFDTLDFGSFVSPQAIPQMRDTSNVLEQLELDNSKSKLLSIVANVRGAEQACDFDQISYLGFPLSLSETFQQRNTNKSIEQALVVLANIQELCSLNGKELVTYFSMGFGNPYADEYNESIVGEMFEKVAGLGCKIVSLSDTIGVATPKQIETLLESSISMFPDLEIGAHLHAKKEDAELKIRAAIHAGCQRIDGAILGYGGCPMAEDELVGNMPTELIVDVCGKKGLESSIDHDAFYEAMVVANLVFS